MDRVNFKRMETIGAVFVLASGVLLSFMFELTDKSVMSILFGAVNKSLWEQVKCFGMPMVVWTLMEIAVARPFFKTFIVAKVLGLYIFVGGTILTSSLFIWLSPVKVPAVYLLLSGVFLIISFVFSYKMTMNSSRLRVWFTAAMFAFLLYCSMYFSFSAVPPEIYIFEDPYTQSYGIPNPSLDVGAFYLDSI